jgi:hypothetical protein
MAISSRSPGSGIRPLERQVLRLIGAAEFLSLTIVG